MLTTIGIGKAIASTPDIAHRVPINIPRVQRIHDITDLYPLFHRHTALSLFALSLFFWKERKKEKGKVMSIHRVMSYIDREFQKTKGKIIYKTKEICRKFPMEQNINL